jgi:hypothetical protein
MEKWQAVIRLKFRKFPFRIKVCFSYEWKAWLLAYDLFNTDPENFSKLDLDKQVNALAYGAASWHRIKGGKKVFFTYDDLKDALLKASKAENLKLSNAMSYAKFPDWLKKGTEESDKKKDET